MSHIGLAKAGPKCLESSRRRNNAAINSYPAVFLEARLDQHGRAPPDMQETVPLTGQQARWAVQRVEPYH